MDIYGHYLSLLIELLSALCTPQAIEELGVGLMGLVKQAGGFPHIDASLSKSMCCQHSTTSVVCTPQEIEELGVGLMSLVKLPTH